jgi:hypothetical protein
MHEVGHGDLILHSIPELMVQMRLAKQLKDLPRVRIRSDESTGFCGVDQLNQVVADTRPPHISNVTSVQNERGFGE